MVKSIRGAAALTGLLVLSWPLVGAAQTPAPPSAQQPAATAGTAPLPKVVLFATGGTISNRAGGRLTVEELIASVPNLTRYVQPEAVQFANTASS